MQNMSDDSILKALKAHLGVDLEWLAQRREEIIEPELRIVDPHHHVLDLPRNRYMFDDVLADFRSGHNVVASVHVQAHSMYRADGPEEMKPVGETEFINGVAAQSASGLYGPLRMCAGIVGTTNILLGDAVEPVLEAHMAAGGGRFRGIRPSLAWHESDQIRVLDIPPHLLMRKEARAAIACIDKLNLSLDTWVFFTQLDEVVDVCRSFPGLTVIVNHAGGPVGIGPYAGKREEMFRVWRQKIEALAQCPNAVIKLGGLAMRYGGFEFNKLPAPPSSDLLVGKWQSFIDVCIENFGPRRCMFESNFPIDRGMCNYHVLWNAYKKMAKGYSSEEKDYLFAKTAANTYKLAI
jgi:L-fuconolactonase